MSERAVSVLLCITGACGCNAISGVGDLEFRDGGAAATAGSGGGGAAAEDCLDGDDDDDDGLVDCADPDCVPDFVCVEPVAPAYLVLAHRAYSSEPTSCDDDDEPLTLFSDPAGARCSDCSCGPARGARCSPPGIQCWATSDCSGGAQEFTSELADGACHAFLAPNDDASCRVSGAANVSTPGTCAPAGGELLEPSAWQTRVDACSLRRTGLGCSDGRVCVPRSTSDASSCIEHTGDPCPTSWPVLLTAFASADDDRSCSACTCAESTGEVCGRSSYTA